jgi:Flp pilus assembly protein TadD
MGVARELTDAVPFHSDAWAVRAGVQLKAADAADARASAEKALELDPESPRAHELLGHALLRFGYKDKAREAYEKAIELAAGTPFERELKANLERL